MTFRCRVRPGRVESFRDHTVREQILRGEAECPMEGRFEEVWVAHPADNVLKPAAAEAFPEPCPLCGKKPMWIDFEKG